MTKPIQRQRQRQLQRQRQRRLQRRLQRQRQRQRQLQRQRQRQLQRQHLQHLEIINEYIKNAKAKTIRHYLITVSRDEEEVPSSSISFDTEKEALDGYAMYQDAGFAKHHTTVSLYEPSGKINTKVLKRNQAGDPSFVRQNYIDTVDALHKVKDKLDKEDYETLCIKIVTSFAKDNWRFSADRFLKQLEIERKL